MVKSEKYFRPCLSEDGHAFNLTPRTLCVGSSDIIEKRTGAFGRPLSLFEGVAGTVYYLHDVQNLGEAHFPAFLLSAQTGLGS